MRRVRVTISVVFAISLIVFLGYNVKVRLVEDRTPPVLTCEEEEITISVADGEEALLTGLKAEDNKDGDLTDAIRIASMSHFINGKRTVTYAVFDEANYVSTLERTVRYSDYTSPKIYLKQPLRFSMRRSDELDFSDYYSAEDCLDGNITNQVRTIFGNDYYNVIEGTYPITLQVSNSAGDVCSVPVEMQIFSSDNVDEAKKQYPVLSEYIVYRKIGEALDPGQYLTGIQIGSIEYLFDAGTLPVTREEVGIASNVNFEEPGVYSIDYSYTAEGAPTAVTKMYVVVEEN